MGYDKPPWVFKGRALYQLQLVKSEEARKYVPDKFKLVEAFGYTLGGLYLARYDDSPVGSFDELVLLGGLAWNPPTSCAWAARVYVNDRAARDHGLASVGLPSRLAKFSPLAATPTNASSSSRSASSSNNARNHTWWWQGQSEPGHESALQITNVDKTRGRRLRMPVCTLLLPQARQQGQFAGPRIRLALPSFSGATPDHPALLKYTCDLLTNVRPVKPCTVQQHATSEVAAEQDQGEVMTHILSGKPLLALAFDNMVMTVPKPTRLELPVAAAPAANIGSSKEPQLARIFPKLK